MKTLYILRHAKSSWGDSTLTDFERPLNERGLKAAPLMGDTMLNNRFAPDFILSSPAKRAAQTANLVKEAAKIGGAIRFDDRIYEAGSARLLEVIAEQDDHAASMLLVGHNPGFEGLVLALTGETHTMPTAALAVIDLEIDKWSDVKPASGKLRFFIRPKDLK
jgi:phosphohistidine phosphatase